MLEPKIEFTPIRAGVRSDALTLLDVLIRIIPPVPDIHFVRPPINLGLVLDHSGSMAAAKKMEYAKEAASFAVSQLLPTDRVSVTAFDDQVTTVAPNAPATDKASLIARISKITAEGATALHAGWKEGVKQVEDNFLTGGLNRVILLSDGQANEGVTDPDTIALEAKGAAARGVSTTTMGLGDDYNEDLMREMGEKADGNYYYIESPRQLADIFHTELQGLMANLGQKVALSVEVPGGSAAGEVLNDLTQYDLGKLVLPNLVAGLTIPIIVRLQVPPATGLAEVCRVSLSWENPKTSVRHVATASLALNSYSSEQWDQLPTDPEVVEQVAILMAARAKTEAIAAFDHGDMATTECFMIQAFEMMQELPISPAATQEMTEIRQLQADLAEGKGATFRKRTSWQIHQKKFGRDSS